MDTEEQTAFVGEPKLVSKRKFERCKGLITRRSACLGAAAVAIIALVIYLSRGEDSEMVETSNTDNDRLFREDDEPTESSSADSDDVASYNMTDEDREVSYIVQYFHTMEHLDRWEGECKAKYERHGSDPKMTKILQADCGGGYTFPTKEEGEKRWKVGLVGDWQNQFILELSGCQLGYSCPLSPNCEFIRAKSGTPQHINVYLTLAYNYPRLKYFQRRKDSISVLYWREALWDRVPEYDVQMSDFDLEFGVHHFAGLKSPSFMRPPSFLMAEIYKNTPKLHFAASVISDCNTRSRRDVYLGQLTSILGADRVHHFGKCGNRKFPGKPMFRGLKVLAQYKLCVFNFLNVKYGN